MIKSFINNFIDKIKSIVIFYSSFQLVNNEIKKLVNIIRRNAQYYINLWLSLSLNQVFVCCHLADFIFNY